MSLVKNAEFYVQLEDHEIEYIKHVTSLRQENNKSAGVKDQRQSSRQGIEADGYAGEWAFGKLFGLMPDQSTHPRKGGQDFLVRLGGKRVATVDVKTTQAKWIGAGCALNIWKGKDERDKPNYYALMDGSIFPPPEGLHGKPGLFLYRGSILSTDPVIQQSVKDVGNGPYYAIPADKLILAPPWEWTRDRMLRLTSPSPRPGTR